MKKVREFVLRRMEAKNSTQQQEANLVLNFALSVKENAPKNVRLAVSAAMGPLQSVADISASRLVK